VGCFGYLCKGCGTSIRGNCFTGGEKTVMIHVRHGEELGRVEGHYDEYGRVIEQEGMPEGERFRGDSDGINGHSEICDSEFRLEDSYYRTTEQKLYNGKGIEFYFYATRVISEESIKHMDDVRRSSFFKYLSDEDKKKAEEAFLAGDIYKAYSIFSIGLGYLKYDRESDLYKDFMALPNVKLDKYSGIVAWHSLCYKKATDEEKADLTPSEFDPNQSWGKVRKKYSK